MVSAPFSPILGVRIMHIDESEGKLAFSGTRHNILLTTLAPLLFPQKFIYFVPAQIFNVSTSTTTPTTSRFWLIWPECGLVLACLGEKTMT